MAVGRISKSMGFSLVEVLVATSVLMLVMFIGSYAYSTYSKYWKKELGEYSDSFSDVKQINNLYRIIRDVEPYIMKGGKKGAYFYFEGGKSVLRAATNNSISKPGFPALFEIKAVKNSMGGIDIIYSEFVLYENPVVVESELGEYNYSVLLVSNLDDFSLEYTGWGDYNQWIANEEGWTQAAPGKFGFYSGKDTLIPPVSIELYLRIGQEYGEVSVPIAQFMREQLDFYLTDLGIAS